MFYDTMIESFESRKVKAMPQAQKKKKGKKRVSQFSHHRIRFTYRLGPKDDVHGFSGHRCEGLTEDG
jgi:hypothetical protein